MPTDYSDPQTWFLDLDKDGWFICDGDPDYGDVFGIRYHTRIAAKKVLDDLVAAYKAELKLSKGE